MSAVALGLFLVGMGSSFGVRSFLHLRRTGRTGFLGISGRPGSLEWSAGLLFVAALVLGVSAPVADLLGVVEPVADLQGGLVAWAGLFLAVTGIIGTWLAQGDMGDSWRIGVDTTERTEMVSSGAFGAVRNPIFTAMGATVLGLALLVPNWLAGLGVLGFVLAVEL